MSALREVSRKAVENVSSYRVPTFPESETPGCRQARRGFSCRQAGLVPSPTRTDEQNAPRIHTARAEARYDHRGKQPRFERTFLREPLRERVRRASRAISA